MLEKAGVAISMTQENHCYENAKAERLNGILKQEFGLGETIASKALTRILVKEAVELYNEHRPHTALGYCFPSEAHRAFDRCGPGGVMPVAGSLVLLKATVANATVTPPPVPQLAHGGREARQVLVRT